MSNIGKNSLKLLGILFKGIVFRLKIITFITLMLRNFRLTLEDFNRLFVEMVSGFALHEIICNSAGEPVDYRFLAVNQAFENLTGLGHDKVIGRSVLEVLPQTEEYWIKNYGQVALTGKPIAFDNYSAELDRYYSVHAYCPKPGQFAVLFTDISEYAKALREKETLVGELQTAMEQVKTLRGLLPICSYCKKIKDDEGYWNQLEAFIKNNSDAEFTHSICPDCFKKHYPSFKRNKDK